MEDARRQAEVLQKEGEIDRITCESERSDKEKSRAALQEILDNGGRLLAPAPGTVVRTLERGDKTKEGEDAVILSSADRGFVFEGKLDKDSARRFSAGDKGELHYKDEGLMWGKILEVLARKAAEGEIGRASCRERV